MLNIIAITFRKNIKDIYLLFWSICLPLIALISLFYLNRELDKGQLLAIVTVSIFFYCCTTNSFYIFAQRQRGVFDLLKTTSFSLWKYLLSVTLSQTIIAVVVSAILLLVENSLFNYHLSGFQLFLFMPFFFLASLIFTLIGFCVSAFPKNEGQLSMTVNLIMLPMLIVSSVFFDFNYRNNWLSWLSWLNPFEWLQRGYDAIFKLVPSQYLISIVVLVIFLGLFLIFSKKTFQTERN